MNLTFLTVIVLIGSLFLVALTAADNDTTENGFIGTWTDANYTFTVVQDGSVVTLTGIPFDEEFYFPLQLTGMVSDDTTRLITHKNMTGTMEIRMSDDQMELSGFQTFLSGYSFRNTIFY